MAKGKKTGGRRPGSVNKLSLKLEERMAAMNDGRGFDPLQTLNELVEAVFVDRPDVVARICLGLMEYIYPKKGQIQVTGDVNLNHQFSENDPQLKEKFVRLVKNSTFLQDPEVRKQIIDVTPEIDKIKSNQ